MEIVTFESPTGIKDEKRLERAEKETGVDWDWGLDRKERPPLRDLLGILSAWVATYAEPIILEIPTKYVWDQERRNKDISDTWAILTELDWSADLSIMENKVWNPHKIKTFRAPANTPFKLVGFKLEHGSSRKHAFSFNLPKMYHWRYIYDGHYISEQTLNYKSAAKTIIFTETNARALFTYIIDLITMQQYHQMLNCYLWTPSLLKHKVQYPYQYKILQNGHNWHWRDIDTTHSLIFKKEMPAKVNPVYDSEVIKFLNAYTKTTLIRLDGYPLWAKLYEEDLLDVYDLRAANKSNKYFQTRIKEKEHELRVITAKIQQRSEADINYMNKIKLNALALKRYHKPFNRLAKKEQDLVHKMLKEKETDNAAVLNFYKQIERGIKPRDVPAGSVCEHWTMFVKLWSDLDRAVKISEKYGEFNDNDMVTYCKLCGAYLNKPLVETTSEWVRGERISHIDIVDPIQEMIYREATWAISVNVNFLIPTNTRTLLRQIVESLTGPITEAHNKFLKNKLITVDIKIVTSAYIFVYVIALLTHMIFENPQALIWTNFKLKTAAKSAKQNEVLAAILQEGLERIQSTKGSILLKIGLKPNDIRTLFSSAYVWVRNLKWTKTEIVEVKAFELEPNPLALYLKSKVVPSHHKSWDTFVTTAQQIVKSILDTNTYEGTIIPPSTEYITVAAKQEKLAKDQRNIKGVFILMNTVSFQLVPKAKVQPFKELNLELFYKEDGTPRKWTQYVYHVYDTAGSAQKYPIYDIIGDPLEKKKFKEEILDAQGASDLMKKSPAEWKKYRLVDFADGKDRYSELAKINKNRDIIHAMQAAETISAFYDYYQIRCPEGGLHIIRDTTCTSCKLQLTPTGNTKEYYNKYKHKYIEITDELKRDFQKIVDTTIKMRRPSSKVEALSKEELKEIEQCSQEQWILDWAKIASKLGSTNQFMNLGLSAGNIYENMKNGKFNPSAAFFKLKPHEQMTRLWQLDGYYRYIMLLILSSHLKPAEEVAHKFPAKYSKIKIPPWAEKYKSYFQRLICTGVDITTIVRYIHGVLSRFVSMIYGQDKDVGVYCTKWILEQEQIAAQKDLGKVSEIISSAQVDVNDLDEAAGSDSLHSASTSDEEQQFDPFSTETADIFDDDLGNNEDVVGEQGISVEGGSTDAEGFSEANGDIYGGTVSQSNHTVREIQLPQPVHRLFFPDPRKTFRFTNVSLYSTTPPKQAIFTSKVLSSFVKSSAHVIDGNCCIGGNTWAFADVFDKITAYDIETLHVEITQYNMKQLEKDNVTANVANIIDVLPRVSADAVFLDPPWGGKDYRKHPELCYHYNGVKYSIADTIKLTNAPVIMLKVPVLVNADDFKGLRTHLHIIPVNSAKKVIYNLIVLTNNAPLYEIPVSPALPTVNYHILL